MPNLLATIVLLGYPLVVAALFMRLPRAEATVWAILAGYLLLPEKFGFNPPMLPDYTKHTAPVYAALLMLALLGPQPGAARTGWMPPSNLLRILLFIFVISPLFTVFLNRDPFVIGDAVLPGQSLYDAASTFYRQIGMVLPLLLARRAAADATPARTLGIFVIGGLLYTLPMLFEIRMAPVLSAMVYGYTPFDFAMTVRNASWRPTVFLNGGIALAIFTAMVMIFAIGLWRAERGRWLLAAGWLAVILLISNSLGGLVLGVVFGAVAVALRPAKQALVAAALATAVLLYPMLRSLDVVPTSLAVRAAAIASDERSRSLEFRIINEDMLMARASERPIFGWGLWGRSRVRDPETGDDITVADGRWIITFGVFGWSGYIAEYGLLTAPIIMLGASGALRRRADAATTGLALGLLANLVDSIPNDTIEPVTWAASGLLIARIEALRRAGDAVRSPSRADAVGAAHAASGREEEGEGSRRAWPPPRGA